jgi:hypothetical protein
MFSMSRKINSLLYEWAIKGVVIEWQYFSPFWENTHPSITHFPRHPLQPVLTPKLRNACLGDGLSYVSPGDGPTTEPFTQGRMKPNSYALSAFAQVEFYGFLATKFQPALIIELPAKIERI